MWEAVNVCHLSSYAPWSLVLGPGNKPCHSGSETTAIKLSSIDPCPQHSHWTEPFNQSPSRVSSFRSEYASFWRVESATWLSCFEIAAGFPTALTKSLISTHHRSGPSQIWPWPTSRSSSIFHAQIPHSWQMGLFLVSRRQQTLSRLGTFVGAISSFWDILFFFFSFFT